MKIGTFMLAATTAVVVVLVPASQGWGYKGHEVIGFIADRYLEPSVKTKLRAFCRSPSLAFLSNWADVIRDDHPETAPWHYVNVDPDSDAFDRTRDVPPQGCVVDRIEHFRAVLADETAEPAERLDALRWLVHLVGDLHQPLHVSREEDRGGNSIRVTYRGSETNLHSFWDTDLIELQNLSAGDYARELRDEITDEDVKAWQRGTPADWATESWRLAREFAYCDADGHEVTTGDRLGRRYVTTRTPVVDRQLRRAGVRLAWIINQALAEKPAESPQEGGR